MEKYNLDEKGGLFKFVEKKPSKVVKSGDAIEMKHFNFPAFCKFSVLNVGEMDMKIQCKEKIADPGISAGDHAVLHYRPSNETFVVTADIAAVDKADPIEVTVRVSKIEKLKDLIKDKKYCVSLPASVKIIGVPESKFAAVKNISFGGIKANCKEDIMLEDMIDVTVSVDKMNKMTFKGRVVRKNKLNDLFEYGIEYAEMTESSNKVLTRCMYDFENMT